MQEALREIHDTLAAKGFQFKRPPATYTGDLSVHGNKAQIELEIPDVMFAVMPSIRLLDRSKLPIEELAHLTEERGVCYVGEAGLMLDLYNPGGSILRVLEEASTTLGRSFGGKANAEFERELQSYWGGSAHLFALSAPPNGGATPVDLVGQSALDHSGVVVVPRGAWNGRDHGLRAPGTVLWFRSGLRRTRPLPLNNLADIVEFIAGQSAKPEGWRAAIVEAAVEGRSVFLAAPNAVIGWRAVLPQHLKMMKAKGFRPSFYKDRVERSLSSITIDRTEGAEASLRFCVERNLQGSASLIGKNVVLIGCGTIGGYLARMLAQSGAGCEGVLTLYDNDILSPGNLGRHLLGFEELGKPKAAAVAAAVKQFHPDVRVEARGVDAAKEWAAIEQADLVIDATGEPNVTHVLNHAWLTSNRTGDELALLHAWVFGNGVAAQTFLNLKDGHACFRCLRTGFDGEWRHSPLRDSKSPLRQAPGRCGAAGYVPFGVDAPVAAAALAARAALDWASGKPGKRLRTTIVDAVAGRKDLPWVSPDSLKDCSACGS